MLASPHLRGVVRLVEKTGRSLRSAFDRLNRFSAISAGRASAAAALAKC